MRLLWYRVITTTIGHFRLWVPLLAADLTHCGHQISANLFPISTKVPSISLKALVFFLFHQDALKSISRAHPSKRGDFRITDRRFMSHSFPQPCLTTTV